MQLKTSDNNEIYEYKEYYNFGGQYREYYTPEQLNSLSFWQNERVEHCKCCPEFANDSIYNAWEQELDWIDSNIARLTK